MRCALPDPLGDTVRKIGAVDDDQHGWVLRNHGVNCLVDTTDDQRQTRQNGTQSHDGNIRHIEKTGQAEGCHSLAADTAVTHVGI